MAQRSARAQMPKIPVLDGFRGYAILLVVGLHLLAFSGALAGKAGSPAAVVIWGIAGNVLDVFFILSGFLLFLPVVVRGGLGDLRAYAAGRAARIMPGYWLALVATFAVAALVDGYASPAAGDVLVHAATLQEPARLFDPQLQVGFGVNGALWMVSVIVAFYVVLPLIARPYLRHPLLGLAVAAAVTLGWRLAVTEAPSAFAGLDGTTVQLWVTQLMAIDQLPSWSFSFALGMTGAWVYVRMQPRLGRESTRRGAVALALCSGAAFAACAYLYGRDAAAINTAPAGSYARLDVLLGFTYSGVRALLMAAILAGPLWLQRPFTTGFAKQLSTLSLGLYVIHLPVAIALGAALLGLPSDGSAVAIALWLGIIISASLLYAAVVRRYVELPVLAWTRGARGPRQEGPAQPEGAAQPATAAAA